MFSLRILLLVCSLRCAHPKRMAEDATSIAQSSHVSGESTLAKASMHHSGDAVLSANEHLRAEVEAQKSQPDWLLVIHGTPCLNPQFTPYTEHGLLSAVGNEELSRLKEKAQLLAADENCKLCTIFLAKGRAQSVKQQKVKKNSADINRVICTIDENTKSPSAKQLGLAVEKVNVSKEQGCFDYAGQATKFINEPDTCMPCPGFCTVCIMHHYRFSADSFDCVAEHFKYLASNNNTGARKMQANHFQKYLAAWGLSGMRIDAGKKSGGHFACPDALKSIENGEGVSFQWEPAGLVGDDELPQEVQKYIYKHDLDREKPVWHFWKECTWSRKKSRKNERDFRPPSLAATPESIITPPLSSVFVLGLITCRSTANVMASSQVMFEAAQHLNTVIEDHNCGVCSMTLKSDNGGSLQVSEAKCETETLGVEACSRDRGPVGWSKKHLCAPCPPECTLCEDYKNEQFKCVLAVDRPVETSALVQLMDMGTLNAAPYNLPEGFSCEKPTPRNSDVRQWKVHCTYKTRYE